MGILSTYPTLAGQHHTTHEPAGEDVVVGIAPAAHEATHILGGADDIDSGLDARALNLAAQGEIVFHAAAANTLVALAVGAAGDALLSGGAGADPSWGAPAPAAHVLATTGPHSAPLPLIDLEVGVQGEVIIRGAADWEALAVGAANQALISGGAGVDPSWGAPTPAAHVLATTGPHTNALPLTDLEVAVRGEIITRTVADWAALGVGVAGEALLSGGAGADVSWGTPTTQAHVLATTGPHSNTLPLTDLVVATRGEVIHRGVADWEVLATGTALQALLSGGAGADVSWGAPTPAAHVLNTSGPHTGTLQDSDVAGHAVGEVLAIISCGLSGPFTTTAGAATVIDYTDFLLNISDFPADAKAILRIVWKNSGNNTNNMDLYDQFGAAPVANSSESEGMATNVWEISETDAPFTLPAGLKSFQLRLWTSGGTLTVAKAELQIERAA